MTDTITISKAAATVLHEIAAAAGCTPEQYVEALLHYGASCAKRPGSWEANIPFDLRTYRDAESFADRWF